MDIVGYVFLGVAVISLFGGLAKGFVQTLLGLASAVGSVAVAILLTPTVIAMPAVQNLIKDTPIIINGQEMFLLRTIIVFFALFVLTLLLILAIKGILKAILKRTKVLKLIDRLLGAVVNVIAVWAVFGILFTLSSAGTDWLVEIENQLASSGVQMDLASIVGDLFSLVSNSKILNAVFSTFNPVGDLVAGLLL